MYEVQLACDLRGGQLLEIAVVRYCEAGSLPRGWRRILYWMRLHAARSMIGGLYIMKYSGIGGQALIEGIMMRNGDKYSVAVRKPDGEIALEIKDYHSITDGHKWMQLPIIRGAFRFIDSLIVGIGSLMYSASFYEDEEDPAKDSSGPAKQSFAEKHFTPEQRESMMMTFTIILSLCMAIGLFMLLPVAAASLLRKVTDSSFVIALAEGVLRILVFIGYISLVSHMKDIRRTFMYHGAEHKCINCIEHGLPLDVEHVRISSKEHKRCGTSFMLIVMVISIIVFMFVRVENIGLRLLSRIVLVPLIAGLSYELLQFTGRHEGRFVDIISRPGLWLQGLTTKEPEDDMIEVAIEAVEAVFDWRAYEEELKG